MYRCHDTNKSTLFFCKV